MRRRNRSQFAALIEKGRGSARFEATIIAAHTAADMADAESALLAECQLAGRSIELLGSSSEDRIRIYRLGLFRPSP